MMGEAPDAAKADAKPWAAIWFENDRMPRLVVSRALEVLVANAAARALMARNPCLSDRGGVLCVNTRRGSDDLQALVNTRPISERPIAICPMTDRALMVRAFPIADDPAVVALTLHDLTAEYRWVAPDLEQIFGVTPAEVAIIDLLLQGLVSKEVALRLNKSVLTVRTHVKRIYVKLNVSSREQFFARILPYLSTR
jgi:DNA-binding CsgD family transcriptional regulator